MSQPPAQHTTFTIDRVLNAPPAQVFKSWSEPSAKSRWFSGPPGQWKERSREFNFRVGGREALVGLRTDGKVSTFAARYLDIVPEQRIVYSYEMYLDQARISISLATVQFSPTGAGTRMTFTEHAVFLDGHDDAGGREKGTRALIDQLEASLRVKPAR